MKYIDSEKLIAEIERLKERAQAERVLYPKTILSAKNYLLIKDFDALLSIITSLQQEQLDIDEIKREWYNKGYFEGRKNAHIPARELGLPKSWDFQQEQSIQVNTLTWKDINDLERIINNVHYEFRNGISEKGFGEEVLERFMEERDEQEQPEVDKQ